MCIGEPMTVVSVAGDEALCRGASGEATIDIRLVPEASPGDRLLVFLGAARRPLSEEEADAMARALAALGAVAAGAPLDGFFADLEGREPALPPHMEAARRSGHDII